MKFALAWADVIAQNLTLKAVVALLSVTTITLTLSTIKLALRQPTIIDRACSTKIANIAANTQHTTIEIEAFLNEAISERYDSQKNPRSGYLSEDEVALRNQEQRELLNRNMIQRVLVNPPLKIDGTTVTLSTDRLISVGSIRSAFVFPLKVELSSVDRTDANPYGLMIKHITLVKTEENKQ